MSLDNLKQKLAGADVSFAKDLDGGDIERYIGLLDAAQDHQAQSLREAAEESLKHVPRLLRPAVRKLLF